MFLYKQFFGGLFYFLIGISTILFCIYELYYYFQYFLWTTECSIYDPKCISQSGFLKPPRFLHILPSWSSFSERVNNYNMSFIVMIIFYLYLSYFMIRENIVHFKNMADSFCVDPDSLENQRIERILGTNWQRRNRQENETEVNNENDSEIEVGERV